MGWHKKKVGQLKRVSFRYWKSRSIYLALWPGAGELSEYSLSKELIFSLMDVARWSFVVVTPVWRLSVISPSALCVLAALKYCCTISFIGDLLSLRKIA